MNCRDLDHTNALSPGPARVGAVAGTPQMWQAPIAAPREGIVEVKRLSGPKGRGFFSYSGLSLPVDELRWVTPVRVRRSA